MKTLRNKISFLIQQAILKGRIPKLEKKLFTNVLNYYVTNNPNSDPVKEEKVITLLNHEVIDSLNRKERLNNTKSFNNFGEYLKILIEEDTLVTEVLCQACNIETSIFFLLLENKIKILDFGVQKIAKLAKYLNLKTEIVKELLIKTIWLNSHNFSEQKALASYGQKKDQDKKDKANQSQKSHSNTDELIYNFLIEFEKHYNQL